MQLLVTTTAMPAEVEMLRIQCHEENLGVEPYGVDCQAVLVDVPLLLKDVVKVPDLDAPVDGGSNNTVVRANHQRLDLHNSLEEEGVPHEKKRGQTEDLEVSDHPLHQVASLHVPAEQFLPIGRSNSKIDAKMGSPYPCDCQLVIL